MRTESLEEFLVLANRLNFRRTAAELHMTHQALSVHISELEKELGFTLFERGRTVKLTEEGKRFYLYAQRALDAIEEGKRECRSISKETSPAKVQWSSQESGTFERLLLATQTPFVVVKPRAEAAILSSLTTGYADVVVAYCIDDIPELSSEIARLELCTEPIGEERLSILTSRKNPIAAEGRLTRGDLMNAEVVLAYGSLFDHVKLTLRSILGKELNLKFIQDPALTDIRDIPYCNLDRRLLPNFKKINDSVLERRPDLVSFDEIDGQPMVGSEYLVYSADNPNPNVHAFVKEIRRLVKAGAPST